jgi:hypothetical protein
MSIFKEAVGILNKNAWGTGELYMSEDEDLGLEKPTLCVLGAFFWAKHPEFTEKQLLEMDIEDIVRENGPELAILVELASNRIKAEFDNHPEWYGDEDYHWPQFLEQESLKEGSADIVWHYNDSFASEYEVIDLLNECDARMEALVNV